MIHNQTKTCFELKKKTIVFFKKYEWPRNYIIPFPTHGIFLYYPVTCTKSNDIEGKGKIRQHIDPLPFNPFLLMSKLEEECADKMCKYQEIK